MLTHEPDLAAFLAPIGEAGPMTIGMMVSSVDGRATVGGSVGALTGPADQALLLGARELAAAVVAGGRTVRVEGYDHLLDDQAQARRRARGLPPEPELVIFTRASPSLPELWRELRARYPHGLVVCEGGPTLLGMAIANKLIDQLVVCLSPRIVGDQQQKQLLEQHAGSVSLRLELLALTNTDDFLFLRYGLR
jgi:riboflavin biosynthesis pyrimidine reductase